MTFPELVKAELERARSQHPPPLHSNHEGYAVLLEEVDEVKAEVWHTIRRPHLILGELVQVAAMAQRWAEDVLGVKHE